MFLCPPQRLRTSLFFCALLVVGALAAGSGQSLSATTNAPSPSASGEPSRGSAVPEIRGRDDFGAMLDIAKGYGDAELTETETGDPVIVGTIDGTAYQLFFLECSDHRACNVLNFYAIWDSTDVDLERINEWNRAQPFHKSYLTEDGQPTIELNLSTAGGITGARFADAFDRWTIALAEFQRQVLDAQF